VLLYAYLNLRRALVAETRVMDEGGLSDERLNADQAYQRADELSSQGDYRHAIRYLYLSALLFLEERGLLRYDRSKTNREVLDSVTNLSELANGLAEVIEVFDRVWYGFYPLDEAAYRRYATRVAELRRVK